MKVKATLYIRKQIWIEEEIEVDVPNAQSNNDVDEINGAIEDAYSDWADSQEDADNPTVYYELDDWGYETIEEGTDE